MNIFKVGDKGRVVHFAASANEFEVGTEVTAVTVEPPEYEGDLPALWRDAQGNESWLYTKEVELCGASSLAEQFIVSYTPFVYDSLAEAEADAIRRFSAGDAVVISKVIRHAVIELTLKDQV